MTKFNPDQIVHMEEPSIDKKDDDEINDQDVNFI